jgi:hypothetical protein
MRIPKPVLALFALLVVASLGWAISVASGRNPLPVPDPNYAVFTTPSVAAQHAIVDLLRSHGIRPRYRMDSDGVHRAILWDGTIVNHTAPELFERLGRPAAAIGLVDPDPAAAALRAVRSLRERGFTASMIEGAEPGLPIVFVTTDALNGSVIVIRKHRLRMGAVPPRWSDVADDSAPPSTHTRRELQ